MSPPEIESRRARMVFEEEPKPWHTAPKQIRFCHARQRPVFEVLPLNRRVENYAASLRVEAHPELDVLHRRCRKPLFVEPAERQKDVTLDRAEPGPKRGGDSSAFLMNVMMEEVPEVRDHAVGARLVIVGAEDRGEACVVFECFANPGERVAMHLDVCVDEDQHIAARPPRA